jgi:hypothetical protein
MKLSLFLAIASFCLVVYGCHDAPVSVVKRVRARKFSREPQAPDTAAPVGEVVTLEQRSRERQLARRYR